VTRASLGRLADASDLERVADEWDELVRRLARPTPFLLSAWLLAWWRHYGQSSELRLHVARRDGRLVAALPLQMRERLGVRIAEFVGGTHAQLADVLLAPGESAETGRALLAAAAVGADLLDLAGLPETTPLAPRLRMVPRIEAPVVDLATGWDAVYGARLSSKRRSQHRKRLRGLEAAGRMELRVAREPDELERALEDALRLHELRWRGRRDRSAYGLPRAAEFHRDLLGVLARAGAARIATLSLDGRAIAYRYGIRVGDSLVGNGIGFDPAYASFSPGWVLLLAALEDAAAEGIRRVELLGGDETYKLQVADPAPLYRGLAAHSPAGRVLFAAALGSVAARRRLKRSALLRRLYVGRP
jgi:CelD/BcsL family acetyltransferase involved in cellulose biosynthesis